MNPVRPLHLLAGDPRHGVDAYAREIAKAAACETRVETDETRVATGEATHGPRHVHFTDRLWGQSPEAAAARLEDWASRGPLSVTLHDLPQASDGAARPRRAAAYARVCAAARAVVVNSAWERHLLAGIAPGLTPRVIHLTIPAPARPAEPPAASASTDGSDRTAATVGLLGWIYPGKGHAEAIRAVAEVRAAGGPELAVLALGGVSAGHERDVLALRGLARAHGVALRISGYLEPDEMAARARAVTVPLLAHQHVSASGSLSTWIGFGRRPLAVEHPYFVEIEARHPGSCTLVAPNELAGALADLAAAPGRTWSAQGALDDAGLGATARAHLAFWETVPW